ncbi:hypothetical protein [Streptomyces lydicus]|uniref:hypothetical protein n=1 Tax=Streptomyces lydicus TaxID=47763 RepID=UPI001010831F|nr:hypothetical protein [Streptomyces lydicus]
MGAAEDAVRGIEVRSAADLLRDVADSCNLDVASWNRVREGLRGQDLGVMPHQGPTRAEEPVVLFPAGGVIGRVLAGAAVLCETGGQAAAEELAEACRSLAALTSIPSQRLLGACAVPVGASPRDQLDQHVAEHGGGYLAMPAASAVRALGRQGRSLRTRDGVFPLPRTSDGEQRWVVVRHSALSAVGVLLTGIEQACTDRTATGVEWLMDAVRTVAAAFEPGPYDVEWPTQGR